MLLHEFQFRRRLRRARRDIDFLNNTLLVRASKTEAGERMIPMNNEIHDTILGLRERARKFDGTDAKHYVFPACERGHIDATRHQKSFRTAWRNLTRAISNDADRFKRFYFLFFLSTNTPFLWHADRVSVTALFSPVSPQLARAVSLHRFGSAHQTSLRSRSTMMSYAISPEGGGSPNQSDGDSSHHNAVQAFPHRQHRFSVASVHDDRTLDNQSGPAT
jgi:hypothetical protein